jgi:hypothetical protein
MKFFATIKHWGGIVLASVLGELDKATKDVDAVAPTIEKMLNEGATVADLIPGVGPEAASFLNLGTELTGALNKTLDFTDVEFQAMVKTAQEALPAGSGVSVVLVAESVVAEAKQWFAQFEAEITAAKTAATAITGTAGAPAAKA